MSWYFDIVGKTEDVANAVEALDYVPLNLKQTVNTFAQACINAPASDNKPEALRVKSSGHYDPNGISNISEFSITPINLAAPVVKAPEEPRVEVFTGKPL